MMVGSKEGGTICCSRAAVCITTELKAGIRRRLINDVIERISKHSGLEYAVTNVPTIPHPALVRFLQYEGIDASHACLRYQFMRACSRVKLWDRHARCAHVSRATGTDRRLVGERTKDGHVPYLAAALPR